MVVLDMRIPKLPTSDSDKRQQCHQSVLVWINEADKNARSTMVMKRMCDELFSSRDVDQSSCVK